MNSDVLKKLTENYGDAFYVLDSEKFRSHYGWRLNLWNC